jgi:isocitrate dehydrogenase kinase/phosphatase
MRLFALFSNSEPFCVIFCRMTEFDVHIIAVLEEVPTEILTLLERPLPAQAVRELYDHIGCWPERQVSDLAAVLERISI